MGVYCLRDELQHIQVSHSTDFNLSDWTIGAFIRPESTPGASTKQVVIGKGGLGSGEAGTFELAYEASSGGSPRLRAGFLESGTLRTLLHTVTLTLGRWYFIAATYDDATRVMTLYLEARELNGVAGATTVTAVATDTLAGSSAGDTNTHPVRIGASTNSSGAAENGADLTIAEAFVYSSALSSATIDSRLATRRLGSESDLVAYWPMDEYSGSTAYDCTVGGNGHNGTIDGPMWADDPVDLEYHTYASAGAMPVEALIGWRAANMHPLTVLTLASGSEDSSYPVTRLRDPNPTRTHRTSTDAASHKWQWNLNTPTPIWGISIVGHNIRSNATTIRLQLDDEGSFTSAPVNIRPRYHPDVIHVIFAAPKEYQFVELEVDDTGNSDGYTELGFVAIWNCEPLQEPALLGAERRRVADRSTAVAAGHGHRTSTLRGATRPVEVTLPPMWRGRSQRIYDVLRGVGDAAPVCVFPEVKRRLYLATRYGRLSKLPTRGLSDSTWTYQRLGAIEVEPYGVP